jgi:hypothetical protein
MEHNEGTQVMVMVMVMVNTDAGRICKKNRHYILKKTVINKFQYKEVQFIFELP